MKKRLNTLITITTLVTSYALCSLSAYAADFLPDTRAFQAMAIVKDNKTIEVHWSIEPGYHMYKNALGFSSEGHVLLGAPEIPKGTIEYNKALDLTIEQYTEHIVVRIPIIGSGVFKLHLTGQGCADAGLCYPPFERILVLNTQTKKLVVKK